MSSCKNSGNFKIKLRNAYGKGPYYKELINECQYHIKNNSIFYTIYFKIHIISNSGNYPYFIGLPFKAINYERARLKCITKRGICDYEITTQKYENVLVSTNCAFYLKCGRVNLKANGSYKINKRNIMVKKLKKIVTLSPNIRMSIPKESLCNAKRALLF